jgi:hypothetical protein
VFKGPIADKSQIEVFIPYQELCIFVNRRDVLPIKNPPEEFRYLRRSPRENPQRFPPSQLKAKVDSLSVVIFNYFNKKNYWSRQKDVGLIKLHCNYKLESATWLSVLDFVYSCISLDPRLWNRRQRADQKPVRTGRWTAIRAQWGDHLRIADSK